MGFYEQKIAPHLVTWACSVKPIRRQREKVVPLAHGRVLEVGFGAGLNLPYYRTQNIEHLFALEPSHKMRQKAAKRVTEANFPVEFLDLPGEQIPLDTHSVDSVLITYTMCTIADVEAALAGIRRVLKPAGSVVFCEHGKAPDASVRRWQERLNPIWRPLAGGCNLNRDVPALLKQTGFRLQQLEQQYLPNSPKFAGYNYWGVAVPA